MEKLNRWVAKHVWPVYIGGCIFLYFLMACLMSLLPPWGQCLSFLGLAVAICGLARWVFRRGNELLKQPMAVLEDQNDPDPYLEEAHRQQNYPGPSNLKLVRITILSAALYEIGEYAQSHDLLTTAPTELVRRAHPVDRVCYFHMLFSVCAKLEKAQEAEISHLKLLQAYDKIRRNTHKKRLKSLMESHHTSYLYFKQEYAQALQAIKNIQNPTLRSKVLQAWALARLHWKLCEKEKAVDHLEFVIKNGNKLYVVTEAQELLTRINTEE